VQLAQLDEVQLLQAQAQLRALPQTPSQHVLLRAALNATPLHAVTSDRCGMQYHLLFDQH
jgi:hypothetical protein